MHFSLSPIPWQPPFYFVSLNLTTLETSCKWNPNTLRSASLCIMSRFIHVAARLRISFLFEADTPLNLYATFYSSSITSINGYLGCIHLLALVNNAAVKMGVQNALQDPAFNSFGYVLRRERQHSIFYFLRSLHIVFFLFFLARKATLFGKPADQEDGRLMP